METLVFVVITLWMNWGGGAIKLLLMWKAGRSSICHIITVSVSRHPLVDERHTVVF